MSPNIAPIIIIPPIFYSPPAAKSYTTGGIIPHKTPNATDVLNFAAIVFSAKTFHLSERSLGPAVPSILRRFRKSELRHKISSSDLLAAASSAVSSAKKRNVARLIKKFCVPRFQLIRRSEHRNQVAGELYGGFHIAVWPIQPDCKIDTIMHNDLLSLKNACLCV